MSERRRVHLGVQYNAEDPHEIWHRDKLDEINTRRSFERAASSAEAALCDFFFQAETSMIPTGPRGVAEPYVVGRADNITVQSYLAALHEHIGFVSTINTTNNNPLDIARRLASLDAAAPGRAGWNLVLGASPLAKRNYRDVGDRSAIDRYRFGEEALAAVRYYLSGEARAQPPAGEYVSVDAPPLRTPGPGGLPFVFYAGDSSRSRDFAATNADAIYTNAANVEHGVPFTADMRRRVIAAGRDADAFKVFARLALVVAETDDDARALQHDLLPYQVHPQTVQRVIDAVWGDGVSDFDPDGPFPSFEPAEGRQTGSLGSLLGMYWEGDARRAAAYLRGVQRGGGFGARQAIVVASGTDLIVGGARSVAERLASLVAKRASDGFVIVPHIAGTWLESFAKLVVPELQHLGVYPSQYREESLRERVLSSSVE